VFESHYLINKLRELINKSTHDILGLAGSIILASIIGSRKSQTRREAGAESHGSLRDSRVAWKKAARFFFRLDNLDGKVVQTKIMLIGVDPRTFFVALAKVAA